MHTGGRAEVTTPVVMETRVDGATRKEVFFVSWRAFAVEVPRPSREADPERPAQSFRIVLFARVNG
jgi:hypothetical protein